MNDRERERIRQAQHVNSNLKSVYVTEGEYNDPFENVDLQDPATYDTPELSQPAVLAAHPGVPTFGEAAASSAAFTLREGTSTSRHRNRREHYAPRTELINRLIESGDIPEDVITANTNAAPSYLRGIPERDDDGIAQWRQAQGYLDLDTDEQLDEGIRDTLKQQREEHGMIMEDAGFAGVMGAIAGGFTAMVDPINIASMFIPIAGPAANAGRLANAARVGVSAGLANMLAEAAVQTAVIPYKDEIDSPYSAGEAATAVVLGGVGGLALGGLIGGLKAPIRPSFRGLSAMQEAQRLAPAGSAERAAIDAAIEEQGPLYNPIDTENGASPERMEEVAAQAEALPPQSMVAEDGTTVDLRAEARRQDERVTAIDKIYTCMFGGSDG